MHSTTSEARLYKNIDFLSLVKLHYGFLVSCLLVSSLKENIFVLHLNIYLVEMTCAHKWLGLAGILDGGASKRA